MKSTILGAALLVLALPALGQPAAQQADKLGPGDAVRVTVFQQPDLTTEARVSDRGTISLPLIGETKVGGATAVEAATHIADAFKKGQYLKSPQVTVALTAVRSRQVSVLGLVARPGRYVIEDAKPGIPDVIASAGGIAAGGSETVTVIRNGQSQKVNSLAKDFVLKPGDTVYVERGPTFYIYGEVTRAGAYPLQPGMTVMQAISVSGGITPRGSERRLKLRRPGPDGKVEESDAKLQDQVKADDVIFVREALF